MHKHKSGNQPHGPANDKVEALGRTGSEAHSPGNGEESIKEVEQAPKVKELIKLFLGAGQKQPRTFDRPHGTLQLLLGIESRSLHSKDGCEAGDLRLNRTLFHPGWVLIERALTQSKGVSRVTADFNSAQEPEA